MSINTSIQKDDIDINLLHPEWKMGFLGQEIVDQTPNYDKSSVSILKHFSLMNICTK